MLIALIIGCIFDICQESILSANGEQCIFSTSSVYKAFIIGYVIYVFQDEILSADGEKYILLMQIHIPVFMQLVSILLLKVQIPPESVYNSWSAGLYLSHI